MRALTSALLAASALSIAFVAVLAENPVQAQKAEVAKLVGAWRVVQGRSDGEDLPKEFLALTELSIDQRGGARFAPGSGSSDCKIIGPGQIDLVINTLCSDELTQGIYKLENDRLTICINTESNRPRPTEFNAERGSRRVHLTLQRATKPLPSFEEDEHFQLRKAFYNLKGNDRLREACRRLDSTANLHQIGIAFHSFVDDKRGVEVPCHAIYSQDGKTPLLSWRVRFLPYFDKDKLYAQFRLNEPWDSEHNKKLIEQMPPVFAPPGADPKTGLTYYQFFTGQDTFFEGNKKQDARKVLVDFGHTILAVEGGNPVIWTKPDDLELPQDKARLPQLGGLFDNGMHVLCIEGNVYFMKRPFDPADLRKRIGPRAGGR